MRQNLGKALLRLGNNRLACSFALPKPQPTQFVVPTRQRALSGGLYNKLYNYTLISQ